MGERETFLASDFLLLFACEVGTKVEEGHLQQQYPANFVLHYKGYQSGSQSAGWTLKCLLPAESGKRAQEQWEQVEKRVSHIL